MIVRTRRKNESFLRRIFGPARSPLYAPCQILSEEQFRFEVLKEMYRSDRRTGGRDFGLIRVIFKERNDLNRVDEESDSILAFQERLRITDTIGWYDGSLGFLLPETAREGALEVANALALIAADADLNVDTEVSLYPWDDELIELSTELRANIRSGETIRIDQAHSSNDRDDDHRDDESNHDSNQSPPLNEIRNSDIESQPQESQFNQESLVSQKSHAFVKTQRTPWWKRAVDIVGAGVGLLLLSPGFLVAAIAIKASSRGPVFFVQAREGKNGKPFGILKFRTMVVDAEEQQAALRSQSEQDGPAFKLAGDPRVTVVGKYLRKSCIDELPQLFNILVGHMSLVGPRPLPVNESHACKAWQRTRLTVLPGLTCIWQARGGRDVKFSEWMRMDLEYIEKRSLWFDLRLIFETACLALLHRGSV